MRRVVITGMGVIAAPGASVGDFFSSLVAGRSGSRPIQNLPPEVVSRLNCRIAAEVPGFEPLQHFTEKELDQLDRFSQFALVAARQALAQAGLEKLSEAQQPRTGVCIGTAYGGIETLDTQYFSLYAKNATRLSPLAIPRVMYNAATCQVSMRFQARGPCLTPTTACSSATHALGEAYRMIQQGQADWMLAGGSDAPITYGVVRGWEAMRVLAPENGNAARACRPFSGDRQGIVIGEGAAVFVLEEYEAARRRGAQILAELAGYGANSDASHITQPSVAGPAVAMRLALEDAGVKPEETARELDQVHARARDGGFGSDRAGGGGRGHLPRRHPAHGQLRDPRPRVRPRLRPQPGAEDSGAGRALEFLCLRWAQRRAYRQTGVESRSDHDQRPCRRPPRAAPLVPLDGVGLHQPGHVRQLLPLRHHRPHRRPAEATAPVHRREDRSALFELLLGGNPFSPLGRHHH